MMEDDKLPIKKITYSPRDAKNPAEWTLTFEQGVTPDVIVLAGNFKGMIVSLVTKPTPGADVNERPYLPQGVDDKPKVNHICSP